MIGEALVLAGALFTLVAAVGTLRFSDVFSRMHALSKATAFGLLLAIAGALVVLEHPNDLTFLALAAVLHLVTSPIGNNLLARATYYAEGIPHVIAADDELAQCRDVLGSAEGSTRRDPPAGRVPRSGAKGN